MKKLLLILLCVPLIGLGQQTYVPDDNFEQALINLGYDTILDDYVLTTNINTVSTLGVDNQNIADLTGIEDFLALTLLECASNQLTTLDLSNNINLHDLWCGYNQLDSINLNGCVNLSQIHCEFNNLVYIDLSTNINVGILSLHDNQLQSLDVSNNIVLMDLFCHNNQITSLDLSNATELCMIYAYGNQLTYVNLRNGNNQYLDICHTGSYDIVKLSGNFIYICVDDSLFSLNNWTSGNRYSIPLNATFIESCNFISSYIDVSYDVNRRLLKVTDILGREVNEKRNTPLFYIYNDGTVEKKIIIE